MERRNAFAGVAATRWKSKLSSAGDFQVKGRLKRRIMMSRLQERYRNEVIPALMKRFGRKNPMAVPRVSKVTVNIGMGEASQNVKLLDVAVIELGQIAGQKPVVTRAKKSIANFKIRKGMPIGCCVTLRGDRMYEFLDRLCNVVLPRVRDFRGLPPNAFDGRGNYTMGLRDQLVFPEIDYTRVDKIKGMNITLTTTAKNDEEGRELLKLLGVPLRPQAETAGN
jgi:large subunit ribosomal protein L5